jgi:hypothetical protein
MSKQTYQQSRKQAEARQKLNNTMFLLKFTLLCSLPICLVLTIFLVVR